MTNHDTVNRFNQPVVTDIDREVTAMGSVLAALQPLTQASRLRVLRWAAEAYDVRGPIPALVGAQRIAAVDDLTDRVELLTHQVETLGRDVASLTERVAHE